MLTRRGGGDNDGYSTEQQYTHQQSERAPAQYQQQQQQQQQQQHQEEAEAEQKQYTASSYPEVPEDNGAYYGSHHNQDSNRNPYLQPQAPPPDLPPDLPQLPGDDPDDEDLVEESQQQQYGSLPYAQQAYSEQQQQPMYPDDLSYPHHKAQPSATPSGLAAASPQHPQYSPQTTSTPQDASLAWDTTGSTSSSNGMDLSTFDKEFILSGLAKLYRKKILPLELASRYGHFHSPPLSPSDFDAPPMILLLGQYSVGKTSFVKYLLGRDFPGIRVGPEPTTDRFTTVLWGHADKIIPGAALCSQTDRPFTGLGPFGNNFLSRLEGVELNSPLLKNVTIVDTPGILSGAKQRGRNYDYENVMKWFAERADLIIIMFDAHKLDISDELKDIMHVSRFLWSVVIGDGRYA
jgi:hypothetical protein